MTITPRDDPAGGELCSEVAEQSNKSVIKAMALLTELGWHASGITATELAQKMRMSRPTVFRLLLSLCQTGFVEKESGRYRLGWKLARLGRRADPHTGLTARVQPFLEALAAELNETINYAIVNGEGEFELIAEASGLRYLSATKAYVGVDLPLHASAMGKALLAELPDEAIRRRLPQVLPRLTDRTITHIDDLISALHVVRERGFAVIDDELEDSMFSLAVPVRIDGRLIGLVAVTGPTPRMKAQPPEDLAAPLKVAAAAIARNLADPHRRA